MTQPHDNQKAAFSFSPAEDPLAFPAVALIDALTDHICVLAEDGRILAVNRAWREFALANLPLARQADVGANYYAVCEAVTGDDAAMAQEALQGLRAVAEGRLSEFVMEYPCHSPEKRRWFELRATRVTGHPPAWLAVSHRNVTQRKEAELALQLQDEVVRNMAEGVCLIRVSDETILYANPKFERMLGYGPGELNGWPVLRVNWETDTLSAAEVARRIIAELEKTGEATYEVQNVRKDGTPIWCRAHTSRFQHPVHGPVWVAVHEDITARKEAETALRASEERFRAIADYTAGLECWFGPDGRLIWVNPAVERITGYSVAECLAMPGFPSPLFPADEAARNNASFQEALRGSQGNDWEFRLIRKDGAERWASVSWQPIYSSDGTHLGHRSSVRDITDRKRAELALRASEERYRSLVSASLDAVLLTVPDGRVLSANEAACRMFGRTEAELIQVGRAGVVDASDPRLAPALEERARTGRFCGELTFVRADGSKFAGEVSSAIFRGESGELRTSMVIRDITERRQAEAELASSRKALRALAARMENEREEARKRIALEIHDELGHQLRQQQKLESIGTLASGVAHEINNPITGIMNYAQLIQDRLPPESPLAEFTGEILRETQRVAGIVRNLLTFARNEKQSHSPARIADIIEGTLSLIRTVVRRDDITLTVKVPEDLPQLKCRSQQIQQVLMNLMTNARDALNERYPGHHPDKVLIVSARELEKEGRRWIRVTVEDHGTGILPEVRERMFDPFFTTKPREIGTGLGLSISHGIVREHHGELIVESEPGCLTRMHLDLPVDNGWKV